ncbi:MAG TPA: hypothetical protein VGL61_02360 [Kofleriaceae bacterium]|jgi:hypothetical protein
MRTALVLGCAYVCVACQKSGALDLDLALPSTAALRPANMSTISVVASSPAIGTVTNTSLLGSSGTSATAGELPVGSDVTIDVLFHDDESRLVGVGEADEPIDIVGDQTTTLSLPVRRPFVYTASGSALYSYDPTLDARDPSFQGTLGGVGSPQLAISVGGEMLVVASTNALQVIETDTNMPKGSAISIPGTISDAAPVPGTHLVAVAHSMGLSIVDLDAGTVQTATGAAVDRVTVGPDGKGGQVASGLVDRVVAPASSTDACTGTSMVVSVEVASPGSTLTPIALSEAVSDLGADPDVGTLYAALPCEGEIASLSSGKFTMVSMLSRAAVVTVTGQHIWAAGTAPSTAQCTIDAEGDSGSCSTGATADCTDMNAAIAYVSDGAHLIVQSIPTDDFSALISVDLPEPRETIVSTDDPGRQHAQVLKSLAMTPLDLVALPGGEYVSVVLQTRYFIQSLVDGNEVVLPCLDLTTGDWQLFDFATTTVAQRVRTECDLTIGPTTSGANETPFKNWACDDAPDGQNPTQGSYTPISVGALFGAR